MGRFSLLLLAAAPLIVALAGAALGQAAGAMYVVTYVDVQAAASKDGAALLRQYRDGARQEDGNLEADVGQEIGRPNRFIVVEGWRDKQALDSHDKNDATLRFAERVKAIWHSPNDRRVNHAFSVAGGAAAKGAILVETHVDVIPPRLAETETALKKLADDSRRDAGNVRYDVFQQEGRLNHFNVLAVWKSRAALDAHETAAHRQQFRETVAPMLGALYDERLYKPL